MIQPGNRYRIFPDTLGARLGVLLITFVVMLFAVSMAGVLVGQFVAPTSRAALLITSTLQNVLMFILPACLTALLTSDSVSRYLGLSIGGSVRPYLAAMLFLITATPLMNDIIAWNEGFSLPRSLAPLEDAMRQMEDQAAALTGILLADSSLWGLLSGILLIGVLTGISEEAFFRAGIQRALCTSRVNPHVAIWLTAFLFSAIHLQFYGFVPRLLLGAAFGYMYWSSGSIWVSATAHAFNNSCAVLFEWLKLNGHASLDADATAFMQQWFWLFVPVMVAIICCWNPIFNPNRKSQLNSIYGKNK